MDREESTLINWAEKVRNILKFNWPETTTEELMEKLGGRVDVKHLDSYNEYEIVKTEEGFIIYIIDEVAKEIQNFYVLNAVFDLLRAGYAFSNGEWEKISVGEKIDTNPANHRHRHIFACQMLMPRDRLYSDMEKFSESENKINVEKLAEYYHLNRGTVEWWLVFNNCVVEK